MAPYIEIDNLTYDYINQDGSSHRAIDGVGFAVPRGSFTAVIGQNGSGKSTLARCLNALLIPTEGTVRIDGLDTKEPENLWEVRSRVAMVFQNPDNQIVSSIVEDDIAFGPENLGIPADQIRDRVAFALDAVEMAEFRSKAPHLLSGGQKQRIAIAGAVAMEPDCIVFDEPTAMLDPRGRQDVLEVIRRLNGRGITTILITHFMEEAACADRIVVMDKGRVPMEGTPEELFARRDELKALALGVPAPVELAHLLRQRGVDLPQGIMTAEDLTEALGDARYRAAGR